MELVQKKSLEIQPKISHLERIKKCFDEPKIKDYFSLKEFAQTITKHMVLIGMKNNLQEEVKNDLRLFALSKCKDLCQNEIEMALENERFGEWNKTDHYQLFNVVYFSEIIEKYREWKRRKIIENNLKKEEEKPKEIYKDYKQDLLKVVYSEIKESGFYKHAHHFYLELEAAEKIKLTKKEKTEFYEKEFLKFIAEKKEESREKKGRAAKDILDQITKNKKTDFAIVRDRCRTILVNEYLKNHLYDYETFLKAIN